MAHEELWHYSNKGGNYPDYNPQPASGAQAQRTLESMFSDQNSFVCGYELRNSCLAGSLVGAVDLTLHAVDRSSFHGCIATPSIKAAVPLRLAVLIVWCCVTAVQVTLTVVKFADQLNIPVKDHTIHDRFSLFKKNHLRGPLKGYYSTGQFPLPPIGYFGLPLPARDTVRRLNLSESVPTHPAHHFLAPPITPHHPSSRSRHQSSRPPSLLRDRDSLELSRVCCVVVVDLAAAFALCVEHVVDYDTHGTFIVSHPHPSTPKMPPRYPSQSLLAFVTPRRPSVPPLTLRLVFPPCCLGISVSPSTTLVTSGLVSVCALSPPLRHHLPCFTFFSFATLAAFHLSLGKMHGAVGIVLSFPGQHDILRYIVPVNMSCSYRAVMPMKSRKLCSLFHQKVSCRHVYCFPSLAHIVSAFHHPPVMASLTFHSAS
ncbi:hypothetical protein NP233_g11435 [Leucocoprinus birnbaumii]|uniref:Uncharacterized protein n=1 Tax=Leucocoprinus birnbaumii TaxID=56174 RepID=A0AAD5VGT4_9AGAR|nr:hypothetical protein NP233_g11435 [Leucocoprinus birnbaumii]